MNTCTETLTGWRAMQPTGAGYCSKIAWAADNPGYDADAQPAAELRGVVDTVGDC